MEGAKGLNSLLLDVASSQDVPFCQLQQLHNKNHGATFCSGSFADNVVLICELLTTGF